MHALLLLLQLTGAVTFGPRPKNSGVVIVISSVVDGQSEASDTAELFARKYRELYTCVSYNVAETVAALQQGAP